MGCDIHAYVEHKEHDEFYSYASDIDLDRNYVAFALLAGVRNYFDSPLTPVVAPRGFPEDAAWKTKDSYKEDDGDAHTASYLTLAELDRFTEEYRRAVAEHWPGSSPEYGSLKPTLAMMRELNEPRLVFWFDN